MKNRSGSRQSGRRRATRRARSCRAPLTALPSCWQARPDPPTPRAGECCW
jgi:hypothetical protein